MFFSSEIKQKPFISLKSAKKGTDFVGLKITDSERTITFPMGFKPKLDSVQFEKLDKDLRKQIFLLINSISSCNKLKQGEKVCEYNGKKMDVTFPIKSMLFIIEDFLDRNSYYTEQETIYTHGTNGKINWNKTIKNIKPIITETGIAFLDFIIRKNRIQENQLITELHKYCVFKSFELLGFLFTSMLPEKGLLDEIDIQKEKKYYSQFLQDKIDNTHLERNIELFTNMLDLINNYDSNNEMKNAAYGTNSYQTVWETLVDKVFGTVNQYQKETYFYPHTKYSGKAKRNAPLRPDTIMVINDTCYILDAKYYSYSTFEPDENDDENEGYQSGSIPGSDSIQKQITYAEFVDNSLNNNPNRKNDKFRFEQDKIFNIFILPGINEDTPLKYEDCAFSEWKDNSKSYHYVYAVSLDTEFLLMNGGKHNEELRKNLISIIESSKII